MRRVIVSVVYVDNEREFRPGVVELYGQRVVNYYPISDDDLGSSEWLGGAILLSGEELSDLKEEIDFSQIKSFLLEGDSPRCYAYHVPVHVYESEKTISPSRIILLEDEDY